MQEKQPKLVQFQEHYDQISTKMKNKKTNHLIIK